MAISADQLDAELIPNTTTSFHEVILFELMLTERILPTILGMLRFDWSQA
jgi:hypothetical protein